MDTSELFRFMVERQKIWRLRQLGKPQPWTRDPILQHYQFCNIFRELDKTSQWITKNWSNPFQNHPNLPFALALARRLNWPPTLIELGFPKKWRPECFIEVLEARRYRGEKYITSAHHVNGTTGIRDRSLSSITKLSICLSGLDALKNTWLSETLEETFNNLITLPGFAAFSAYELVTELTYTKHLKDVPDLNTWCAIKQGSFRGLSRVLGTAYRSKRTDHHPGSVAVCIELLTKARKDLVRHDKMFKQLTLRNIEDSLCEFDKYCRAVENNGVGMRQFNPGRLWSKK